jgi:CDP-glucose 4,6-dehydratase
LSGYLWLGSLMWKYGTKFGEGWNFGPKDSDILTVEEVVKEFIRLWGDGNYSIDNSSKLHESSMLKLDISKSRHYLKWKPVYNINESLKQSVDWYSNYYNNKEDIYQYTLNQIVNYVKIAKKHKLKWTDD